MDCVAKYLDHLAVPMTIGSTASGEFMASQEIPLLLPSVDAAAASAGSARNSSSSRVVLPSLPQAMSNTSLFKLAPLVEHNRCHKHL